MNSIHQNRAFNLTNASETVFSGESNEDVNRRNDGVSRALIKGIDRSSADSTSISTARSSNNIPPSDSHASFQTNVTGILHHSRSQNPNRMDSPRRIDSSRPQVSSHLGLSPNTMAVSRANSSIGSESHGHGSGVLNSSALYGSSSDATNSTVIKSSFHGSLGYLTDLDGISSHASQMSHIVLSNSHDRSVSETKNRVNTPQPTFFDVKGVPILSSHHHGIPVMAAFVLSNTSPSDSSPSSSTQNSQITQNGQNVLHGLNGQNS